VDTGDEPDTDFLPDPDKIYGMIADEESDRDAVSSKRKLSDDDSDDDDEEEEDDVDPSGAGTSGSETSTDDTLHSSDQHVIRYVVDCCVVTEL